MQPLRAKRSDAMQLFRLVMGQRDHSTLRFLLLPLPPESNPSTEGGGQKITKY
jgi:hypothetical protein